MVNEKAMYSCSRDILDLHFHKDLVIVLSEIELVTLSLPDFKMLKRVEIKSYPEKLLGVVSN